MNLITMYWLEYYVWEEQVMLLEQDQQEGDEL